MRCNFASRVSREIISGLVITSIENLPRSSLPGYGLHPELTWFRILLTTTSKASWALLLSDHATYTCIWEQWQNFNELLCTSQHLSLSLHFLSNRINFQWVLSLSPSNLDGLEMDHIRDCSGGSNVKQKREKWRGERSANSENVRSTLINSSKLVYSLNTSRVLALHYLTHTKYELRYNPRLFFASSVLWL